jgi:hypothetical protein
MPISPEQFLDEPARRTPVMAEAEVVVLGIDNLLVAGRCASMTQEGQSAARVTGGCFVMGQAAGAAAAMALAQNLKPRAIDVKSLQARLEREGAYLGRDVH